jgi:hypothetical protein
MKYSRCVNHRNISQLILLEITKVYLEQITRMPKPEKAFQEKKTSGQYSS